ncbi:MAG: FHA domain-containing protein [Pseudomonadota bacterium]
MDWLQWPIPAGIGAATSLVVALITTRAQLRRERAQITARMKADVDAWKRQFAEASAAGPVHTVMLAQQFRVGVISLREPGTERSEKHFIPRHATITIGAGENANIPLSDPDRVLSRIHGIFDADEDEDGVTFVDISTNGTFLNGAPEPLGPTRTRLKAGDVLTMGGVEVTFHPLD